MGITTQGKTDYQKQFGIALTPRQPVELPPSVQRLQAADAIDDRQHDLISLAQADLGLPEGAFDMWYAEPPAIPAANPPAIYVVAQGAAPATQSSGSVHRMGVCNYVTRESHDVRPILDALIYESRYLGGVKLFLNSNDEVTARILRPPKHGTLEPVGTAGSERYEYRYVPDLVENDEGGEEYYYGKEQFVIEVRSGGVKVQVHYTLGVGVGEPNSFVDGDEVKTPPAFHQYCPRGESWKISLPSTGDNSNLANLLTAANQNLTFADLSGGAVGETHGTGSEAQITLDTTAAKHGWYIDYTPYLNEEYLPTSNPKLWVAREGSEAAGKMDMLSVLLHEYGHVLGLEHSADAGNFMAATLKPGERRLPSGEELKLMAGLLDLAKHGHLASSVPYDPFSPPGTPLPMTMSLAAFVATRRRADASPLTQFAVAANPVLTNPQFADSQGWSVAGNVAMQAGAATLKESATVQTRLNQVFVVGENDRFLSFTLSGIALDDVDNAPDDAFEVALIDANTGLSLLGGSGLTRNDAFLNLQADGSEYKAAGVTTVNNADGSRTVLVDLAGIAAGTVVNLSFDLIGFGKGAAATSSQITVKDLRLGVPQEARDDTASLAEDGKTSLAPFS